MEKDENSIIFNFLDESDEIESVMVHPTSELDTKNMHILLSYEMFDKLKKALEEKEQDSE